MLGYAIQSYASMAAEKKQARRATALLAATKKLQEEATDKSIISPAGEADFARTLAIVNDQLDEATFNEEWVAGHNMTLEQAVAYALEETN